MKIKKFIPKILKYPLIVIYVFWKCITRGRIKKEIKLNLAGVLPPKNSKNVIHGGKVKLLHLRDKFSDSWKGFNTSYFVSSGLPFAINVWISIYKLFGIKIVWNQNGVAYGAWAGEKETSINKLMTPIHKSDYAVYQTEFCKKCADKYLGNYKGSWSVIKNPVDTEFFTPPNNIHSYDPLVLLSIGSHFTRERVTIPIQVLRRLLDKGIKTKLMIVGRLLWNNAQVDIKNEIATNEVENFVEIKGSFLQEEAPKIYHSAHILLHMKYLDPCPTVVLEALSCGLPVIGSASGGMPELVNEKSGILIPIKNDFDMLRYPKVEEVTEAVLKIYKDLNTWSKSARDHAVKNFNVENWIVAHEKIFQNLLDGKK